MKPVKTVRLKLKTGEFLLRKSVIEFLVGRLYFVLIVESEEAEVYPVDNILTVDMLINGEYLPVVFRKRR